MTRAMKDSGIEWIGEIPENWEVHPIYRYFTERKRKNRLGREDNLLSLSYGKIIRKDINTNGGLLPESFNTYNIIEAGDIIIRPTDLQNDKKSLRTGLSHEHGIITSAYIALRPNKNVNSSYYHYLLHTYDVQKVFYNMGNGVRQGLNYNEFAKLMVFAPSSNEQTKISNYLDCKCSEIEDIIKEIQAQITTLEEYKKSIISEAVTKGLNPNAPLKDSGVEWIGMIPKNFLLIPLKYIIEYNKETLPETTNPSYEFDYIDIGSVTYGKGIEVIQTLRFKDAPSRARRIVHKDDIILSTVRTYLKATAQIAANNNPIIVSTGFITLTAIKNKILPTYLKYAIQLDAFISEVESKSKGISYPAINSTEVVRIKAVVPPIEEQKKIAEYLDAKCTEIDSAITDKQEQIKTLEEYKKTVIYEYVTGKKEVA